VEIACAATAFALLLGGVVAVFLPVPTPLVSWLGVLVCFLGFNGTGGGPVGWKTLGIATALTVSAHTFEFAGTYLGAKWTGASAAGKWGALLGGFLGPLALLLLPLPGTFWLGLCAGPFIGALAGEVVFNNRTNTPARATVTGGVKVGAAAALSNLAAFFAKFFVALLLFAWTGILIGAELFTRFRDWLAQLF